MQQLKMCLSDCEERCLSMDLFGRLGLRIGARPVATLIGTVVAIGMLVSYFVFFPVIIETDVRRGFAKQDGPSLNEFERFAEFYNLSMHDLEVFVVLFESKDGGRTPIKISPQVCDDIARLDRHIWNMEVESKRKRTLTLSNFATSRGSVNYFFDAFKWAYDLQNEYGGNGSDPSIVLSYPVARIYGYNVSLADHFFGVEVNENFQLEGQPTAMVSANSIILIYILQARGREKQSMLQEWELSVLALSTRGNFSDHFDFYVYGDQLANAEMERGNRSTVSLLGFGVFLMVLFMAFIMRSLSYRTQVVLITTAVVSPLLASLCAFAVIGWLGLTFKSIMSLTPILVLGIGVDDAFLMLHSWRKHTGLPSASERLSQVISDIGPSITITSLTNVIAFGAGAFSAVPVMNRFCVCTSIAVAFDYILEMSIFAPSLAICSRWERDVVTPAEKQRNSKKRSLWWHYSKFLLSRWGALMLTLVVVLLYVCSSFGFARLEAAFDPSKTFPSDSPLVESTRLVDGVFKQAIPINFVVNRPPNISDEKDYGDFMRMVNELESRPDCYGRQRTLLWLFDYEEYNRKIVPPERSGTNVSRTLTYEYLVDFLDDKLLSDKHVVKYHFDKRKSVVIDSFVFVVFYKGADGWYQRARSSDELRNLLLDYPQFNTSLFDYDATIFDLITNVKSETAKAVAITLTCMMCVCFAFMPNITSTTFATLSILSISFNLMGLLSWWGLCLDPVMMINVLMAIGLSVDFSAHICYHFHSYERRHHGLAESDIDDPAVLKLATVFETIGKPMFEAGVSTVLCMMPLFLIPVYLITSFAKTVFVVASLGLLHGLFIVPFLLSLQRYCRRRPTAGTAGCRGCSKSRQRRPILLPSTNTTDSSSNSSESDRMVSAIGNGTEDEEQQRDKEVTLENGKDREPFDKQPLYFAIQK